MYELLSGDRLPPSADLTPGHVRQYLTQVAAEEMRRSLRVFVRRGWKQLQPQTLVWNWHLDAICLPPESLITTEHGPLPIGRLVESGWRGRVLTYCHDTGRAEWRPVTGLMKSRPQSLLTINFSDAARLKITGNHPVYVQGKGYTRADLLRPGDVVLHVRALRRGLCATQDEARQILQSAVFRQAQGHHGPRHVPDVWGSQGLGITRLPSLLRAIATPRPRYAMSSMRDAVLHYAGALGLQPANLWGLLWQELRGGVHDWPSESSVHRWIERQDVSANLSGDASGHASAGRQSLFAVSDHGETGRPSHRSRQEEQRTVELGHTLSPVPRDSAWQDAARDCTIGEAHVSSVERSIRVCDALYNLETEGNHNYFADGILVHNCDHLSYVTMGEIRFLMVSIGPRLSKTMTISVLWPDWHWLHVPGEQFLTAGVDDQLARDSAILSRRLIESEWFSLQYPGEIELYDDENTAGMYRNRKGGYRMIGSLQGRITGVGGTTQILDDPHDAKKIESDQVRHNALAWHDNAWRSRLNNPDTAKKVYVGQRTHDTDIFGHVLSQEGSRWTHLVLPMEFDPARRCRTFLNRGDGVAADAKPIFEDPRTQEREIIDPKRMSAKTVNAEKRIMSEAAWQAQYNQNPLGMGGLILKRHWWRPWVQPDWRANAGEERPMPRFDQIIQVWDTALEEDEQADFSACTTWGTFSYTEQFLDKAAGRPILGQTRVCAMLLDAIQERYSYPDLRARAIALNADFAPDLILVEKKVSGHSLVQELRKKRLPVKAVLLTGSSGRRGGQGDLVARANSASLMLEKGCVFYPPRPYAYAVMEECAKFPNGDHDDYVSTCAMAWMYLRRYHDLQLPDDERDDVSPWAWKRRPAKRYA